MTSAFQPSDEWVAKAKAYIGSVAGRPLYVEESDRLLQSLQDLFEIVIRAAERQGNAPDALDELIAQRDGIIVQ